MAGYGTDEGLTSWLAARGRVLPSSAPSLAILRQIAADYIDATYATRFIGTKTGGFMQMRSWPRENAVLPTGELIPDDVIPLAVEHATYAAVWVEASNSGALAGTGSLAGQVKKEKVDVIEVEYHSTGDADLIESIRLRITEVEGLLSPFLRQVQTGGGFGLCSIGV